MLTDYQQLSDTSKVWIYQASPAFREEDLPLVQMRIDQFVENWISHNRQLKAYGGLQEGRFVVLMVDESLADVSGCSIDSSIAFLKQLQAEFGVDLFDRMVFAWKDGDLVKAADRDTFSSLYAAGAVHDDTLVFDPLVNTKKAYDEGWIKPLKESWHKRMV